MVIGHFKVGKTCLLERFLSGTFSSEYDKTIDYVYKPKEFAIDGNNYKFLFIDFSADYDYFDIKKFSEKTKGIMYVYDITEKNTLDHITGLLNSDDLRDLNKVPKILVGNKCDLEDERKIKTEEGEKLANENRMKFIETSAKDSTNVTEAFNILLKDVKEYMKNNPEKPKIDPVEKLEIPKPVPTEIKENDELRKKDYKKCSRCFDCIS